MQKVATAAKNGQAKNSPKQSNQSAEVKRAEEIARRLAKYEELRTEVHKRDIFQKKLDEITDSREAISDENLDSWQEQKFRRIQLIDRHDRPILTIGTSEIVNDILDNIEEKIKTKIQEIDKAILAAKI
jgi:hypothetical protein